MMFGGLFFLIITGVVLYAVFRYNGYSTGYHDDTHGNNTHHGYGNVHGYQDNHRDPVQILQERYAKGEIDKETHSRMLNEIQDK